MDMCMASYCEKKNQPNIQTWLAAAEDVRVLQSMLCALSAVREYSASVARFVGENKVFEICNDPLTCSLKSRLKGFICQQFAILGHFFYLRRSGGLITFF
jgi:hypothetical protein